MGSDASVDDGPEHKVFIDAFCLDRDEVTVEAFAACVKAGKCAAPITTGATRANDCTFGREGSSKNPINCVTYADATTYCASVGMRLPTEAEWERAASGTADTPWGDEKSEGRANLEEGDSFAATAPVGSFPSGDSTEGIRDLIGNAAEWVADFHGPFSDAQQINPRGPSEGEKRVVKGGSFAGMAVVTVPGQPKARVVATRRYALAPTARSALVGFRCAKALAR
jgi:formylglycine-generating enzyme required for sulfatase activity